MAGFYTGAAQTSLFSATSARGCCAFRNHQIGLAVSLRSFQFRDLADYGCLIRIWAVVEQSSCIHSPCYPVYEWSRRGELRINGVDYVWHTSPHANSPKHVRKCSVWLFAFACCRPPLRSMRLRHS